MGSMNRVILIGRLGRDAEIRTTPSGSTVASMSLATSEAWTDKATGERKEKTTWTRVTLWGKTVDAIGQYLTKGREIAVEGRLDNREYEKDGVKHYATDVRADRVVLLGGRTDGGSSSGSADRTADADLYDGPADADPIPF